MQGRWKILPYGVLARTGEAFDVITAATASTETAIGFAWISLRGCPAAMIPRPDHHDRHTDISTNLDKERQIPIMTFKIETDTPAYVYETMADHLAARIHSGELQPNERLPAERRLAHDYGVSLGTARRATESLRNRGLVFTLRSKGTFITDRRKRPQQLDNGASLHSITAAQEHRISTERWHRPPISGT